MRVALERWPSGPREVVHHPGACAVMAVTASGDVLLIRQMREAVRGPLLEIPAGILDVDGEDGAACAARELAEETGYSARDVMPLGSIYTSPGFSDERVDLFLAEAEPPVGGEPSGEAGIEVVIMSLEDALGAVRSGAIVDAKTVVALFLAADRRR